ncbi:hypothetical protein RE6C_00271 [Rhodopirellula europaea 6C]|uniref:Dockerin type I repeat protein n=1 Tax=Rhodopirellula europaea 6C TaxID=1263867 RepID=M2BA57_9BACT|nr:hypothetical protein RE6C_00271 [Rhodopirellula europaea 6C]
MTFQSLTGRLLLAADLSSPQSDPPAAEIATVGSSVPAVDQAQREGDEIQSRFSDGHDLIRNLGSAFGFAQDTGSAHVGDVFIISAGSRVHVYAPDPASPTDYILNQTLSLPGFGDDASITEVKAFGDLIVLTGGSFDGPYNAESSFAVAKLTADNQLEITDSFSRGLRSPSVFVHDGVLTARWEISHQGLLNLNEFQNPLLTIEEQPSEPFAYDYFILDDGKLGDGVSVVSDYPPSVFLLPESDRLLLKTGESGNLITLDENNGMATPIDFPEAFLEVKAVSEQPGEPLAVTGYASVGEATGEGTVLVDDFGQVLSFEAVPVDADQLKQDLSDSSLRSVYREFSDDTWLSPFSSRPLSSITVLTDVDGQESPNRQQIELPGFKVGFVPAFVLDSNQIVSVRADLDPILELDTDAIGATPVPLTAVLMTRGSNGEFTITDSVSLGNYVYGTKADIAPGGVVTLQDPPHLENRSAQILTAVAGNLSIETMELSGREQVFAAGDARVFASDDSSTVRLVNQTAFEAEDVNKDGRVSALDALMIINQLNDQFGNGEPADSSSPQDSLDVNADGRVSALDALTIINTLNRSSGMAEPISAQSTDATPDNEDEDGLHDYQPSRLF